MRQNLIEKKINICIGTVLIILLLSYVICAVWKSPAVTTERLFDLPASYTIKSEYLYSAGNQVDYQQNTGEFQILADSADKSVIFLNNTADSWKYLKLDISGMNCADIDANLTFRFAGQINGELSITFREGNNVVPLQEGLLFDEILMSFYGQSGKRFHINRFTISESVEEFDWKIFTEDYMIVFLAMLTVVCGVWIIWNKKCTCTIKRRNKRKRRNRRSAEKALFIQSEVERLIPRIRLSESARSRMRTIVFICIFLIDFYFYKLSMRKYYKEALFLTGVGLLIIAWLAWQEERRQRVTNAYLVGVWITLQVMEIISDIIVPKELRFMGLWQLCILGSFFWVWSGMKMPEKLLQNFKLAIHVLYTAMIFYCIAFIPYIPEYGLRYSGVFHNPNPFSLACVLGIVVAVSDLADACAKRKARCIWHGMEIVAGILFIWRSKCRTALLALAVFVFMIIVLSAFRWSAGKSKSLKLAVIGGLILFFTVSVLSGVFVMKYVYHRPIDMTSLDSFTSGRINIWVQHIQNWNILGHKEQITINGNPTYAHNGLLRCMSYYGIFTGAAYVMLMVNCILQLVYVYVCRKVKVNTAILLLGIISSFLVATMLESVEDIPFIWPNWLVFYWMIGALMMEWNHIETKE